MAFVDPFMLVLTLIMTVLLVIANMYFIAYYSHASDKAFGGSTALKFIIVLIKPNWSYIDCFLHGSRKLNAFTSLGCEQL